MVRHVLSAICLLAPGTIRREFCRDDKNPVAGAWKEWAWSGAGPGPRRGHSLALYKARAVVFGGRADDTTTPHVPKTYDITEVNGQIEFVTYTDDPDDTCTVPIGSYYNDVWSFHKAEVYQDHMFIYGGYGQLCTDYCDDMWRFNFEDNTWTEMAALGINSISGPGKRWKFSSSGDGAAMYVFGGYRLWHGFAPQNSQANLWSDYSAYPKGGYLADLWRFTFGNNLFKRHFMRKHLRGPSFNQRPLVSHN
ncbi:hypothetical protein ACHHYP_09287 [Achlya hypogyna]|uniref:Uncharacterized protein n=1 Tax=Achlya hypogyna TaxID=1202772 RepID=A0A1V9ZJ82_ACHHY|nr:hypothetical protein ACHHYP_09287 [Achlya hypogyna]